MSNSTFGPLLSVISPFKYKAVPEGDGFWGPVTATIDWCEENYVLCPYVAEMMNTLTNVIYMILAVKLWRSTRRNHHGNIYLLVSLGLMAVGIGSFMFHMTLQYEYQLLDELPMVYFSWIPLAYILAVDHQKQKNMIYGGMFLSMIGFTLIYVFVCQNPILHQVLFAVINGSIIYKVVTMTFQYVSDKSARSFIFKLLGFATFEAALSFFFWKIDTIYCSTWIKIRRIIGLPLGTILELHGWWHIFMGLTMYHFILSTHVLNVWFKKGQDNYYIQYKLGVPFDLVLKDNADNTDKKTK